MAKISVTAHEAERSEAVLIDVREPYERETARVAGVLPLPLYDLLSGERGLPRDRPLVVVDQDGSRAPFAARILRERGYTAIALEGGAEAWVRMVRRQGGPARP